MKVFPFRGRIERWKPLTSYFGEEGKKDKALKKKEGKWERVICPALCDACFCA